MTSRINTNARDFNLPEGNYSFTIINSYVGSYPGGYIKTDEFRVEIRLEGELMAVFLYYVENSGGHGEYGGGLIYNENNEAISLIDTQNIPQINTIYNITGPITMTHDVSAPVDLLLLPTYINPDDNDPYYEFDDVGLLATILTLNCGERKITSFFDCNPGYYPHTLIILDENDRVLYKCFGL